MCAVRVEAAYIGRGPCAGGYCAALGSIAFVPDVLVTKKRPLAVSKTKPTFWPFGVASPAFTGPAATASVRSPFSGFFGTLMTYAPDCPSVFFSKRLPRKSVYFVNCSQLGYFTKSG